MARGIVRLGSIVAASAWLFGAGAADASELIYHPISPAFGGSPLNSSYILGITSAQNGFSAPSSSSSAFGGLGSGSTSSLGQIFAQQLQSRLLSALADQIVSAIFGQNPAQSGTVIFGDQTVTFSRGLEAIDLTIYDASTGQTTNISVPTLQVQP